uniref:uncharacterized protein LOC109953152 isoform X2 n=1 Tax=Monopterus albus TaxID=43700 RepID=UPI0009B45545|nr:uncharacterized protein LOC109953152 isoform X2 [Monopterus albus]
MMISSESVTFPKCYGTTQSWLVMETSCLFAVHPAPPSPSNQLSMDRQAPLTPSSALTPTRPSSVLTKLRKMANLVLCPQHYRKCWTSAKTEGAVRSLSTAACLGQTCVLAAVNISLSGTNADLEDKSIIPEGVHNSSLIPPRF